MNYKEIIPYKLRLGLSIVAIASATLFPESCSREGKEEEPTREIEIEFDELEGDKILSFELLSNYANDKTIKTIFLVPIGHWNASRAHNITYCRNNFLEPRIRISPKIRGRGDFDFKLGEASKVPDDSLWFVQQGWTINKKYQ